jgi:alcohol dehydrogenase YqhD (iron-dependent ADH family)
MAVGGAGNVVYGAKVIAAAVIYRLELKSGA